MIYYIFFNIIGLLTALVVSKRLRNNNESTLTSKQKLRNFAGLVTGAIIGSKIPVILSYGFDFALILSSKSIFGALIGAFIGINISKHISGIKGNFGDKFILPLCSAVFWGKIGCYFYGCCGSPNHPVQIWTAGFHLVLFLFFYTLHSQRLFSGSHFALYIIFYSIYRFFSEFIRTEPLFLFNLTVYQIMALVIVPYFAYVIISKMVKKTRPVYL